MDSVCYSLLARDRALSIHARFEMRKGLIESLPAAPGAITVISEQQEAQDAESWYRRIVAESFGA